MSQTTPGNGFGAKLPVLMRGKPGKRQRSGERVPTMESRDCGEGIAPVPSAIPFSGSDTPMHQAIKSAERFRNLFDKLQSAIAAASMANRNDVVNVCELNDETIDLS